MRVDLEIDGSHFPVDLLPGSGQIRSFVGDLPQTLQGEESSNPTYFTFMTDTHVFGFSVYDVDRTQKPMVMRAFMKFAGNLRTIQRLKFSSTPEVVPTEG